MIVGPVYIQKSTDFRNQGPEFTIKLGPECMLMVYFSIAYRPDAVMHPHPVNNYYKNQ